MSQIAQLPPLAVRARVTEVLAEEQVQSSNLLPGMMWAVCSDPRPEVRPIEQFFIEELHLRSHCLLLAQFRGEPHSDADPAAANAEREALEQTLKRLETERDNLRQDVQSPQRANTRMNQDNARLQGDLDEVKQHCAALEKQRRSQAAQASQGVTLRDVRKLQYEVARLSDALRALRPRWLHTKARCRRTTTTLPTKTPPASRRCPNGPSSICTASGWR